MAKFLNDFGEPRGYAVGVCSVAFVAVEQEIWESHYGKREGECDDRDRERGRHVVLIEGVEWKFFRCNKLVSEDIFRYDGGMKIIDVMIPVALSGGLDICISFHV